MNEIKILVTPLFDDEIATTKKSTLRLIFEKDGKLEFALAGEPDFFKFQSNMINAEKAKIKHYFRALTVEESDKIIDRPVFQIYLKKEYEIVNSKNIKDEKTNLNDILYK